MTEAAEKQSTGEVRDDEAALPPSASAYEDTHVHAVYDAIAPHFSATRHKPWPRVARFLNEQPVGSIGLDVGCGNGRYMAVNPHIHLLGSDRSAALVRLARSPPRGPGGGGGGDAATPRPSTDVLVADGLDLPYRASSVDFVISIAVVHHLSTRERRRAAVASLLRCARPGAPVLVYVWALEQAGSRRGWSEGSDQDTLVSWVMRAPKGTPNAGTTYQRYYHLYRRGELEEDVEAAGGVVVDAGYEKDNWWAVFCRQP